MEKRKQQRIYQINPQAMAEVEGWARKMTERWQARYSALDEILETEKQKLKKGNKDVTAQASRCFSLPSMSSDV